MREPTDLDEIIAQSTLLKIDIDIATKKYYEIYRYLREKPEYKNTNKEKEIVKDATIRTKNWLLAYANRDEVRYKKNGDK